MGTISRHCKAPSSPPPTIQVRDQHPLRGRFDWVSGRLLPMIADFGFGYRCHSSIPLARLYAHSIHRTPTSCPISLSDETLKNILNVGGDPPSPKLIRLRRIAHPVNEQPIPIPTSPRKAFICALPSSSLLFRFPSPPSPATPTPRPPRLTTTTLGNEHAEHGWKKNKTWEARCVGAGSVGDLDLNFGLGWRKGTEREEMSKR
jgi:hypothetical protein